MVLGRHTVVKARRRRGRKLSGTFASARQDQFNEVTIQGNSIDFDVMPAAGIDIQKRVGILFDTGDPYLIFATVRNNRFGLGILSAILDRAQ